MPSPLWSQSRLVAPWSVARYVLGALIQCRTGFPYGTLAVNVSGSFVLGLLITLVVRAASPELRLLLAIACGG
jgi:CrcB protein